MGHRNGTFQARFVESGHPQPGPDRDHMRDDGQAQADPDEPQHRIHFTAFDGEGRLETGDTARGCGELTQVVSLPEHDEWLVPEVFDPDAAPAYRRRLVRGGHHDQFFAHEFGGRQRRHDPVSRSDDECQVEFAAGQGADEVLGAALGDVQFHLGVGVVESAQDVWHEARAQAGGGADADSAPVEQDRLGDFASGGFSVGQDAASQGE